MSTKIQKDILNFIILLIISRLLVDKRKTHQSYFIEGQSFWTGQPLQSGFLALHLSCPNPTRHILISFQIEEGKTYCNFC